MNWRKAEADRRRDLENPAHILWVELGTRIASRRLHFRSGEEESAAASIHKLFTRTRELMEKHPEAREFQQLALVLLNDTLRPCTARWHGWMTKGEEQTGAGPRLRFSDAWVRRQFRRELRALQPRLVGFTKAFEALKDGKPLEKWWTDPNPEQLVELRRECVNAADANLGKDLAAGIGDQVRFGDMEEGDRKRLVADINQAEHDEIRRRRGMPDGEPVKNATALAFSGGGIRSATFCLGITQVLARRKLFQDFDYMSTVSGGGYLGSFLSAYLGTGDPPVPKRSAPPRRTDLERERGEVADRLEEAFVPGPDQREPRALRHLRNHSRYLADGGFNRQVAGFGIVAMGVIFNLLIVLPLPLTAALLTVWLHKAKWLGDFDWRGDSRHWLPPWDAPWSVALWCVLCFTVLLSFVYPVVKMHSLRTKREKGDSRSLDGWEKIFAVGLLTTTVLFLVWLVPVGFRLYNVIYYLPINLPKEIWLGPFIIKGEDLNGVIGFAFTVLTSLMASRSSGAGRRSKLVKLAILSGPLLCLFIYFMVGHRMMIHPSDVHPRDGRWEPGIVLLVDLALLVWAFLFLDVNTYSPHGYYRDRLSECYLQVRRNKDPEKAPAGDYDIASADSLRLTSLNRNTTAPYHLINATLNLPNSEDREVRGRDADFFLFSKNFCGSPLCGYFPTKELEDADPHIDLGTVMAISGAAVSSNMGWQTDNSLRLLMTLANVRLGYWLRNPKLPIAKGLAGPGPLYLLREMFAKGMDENKRYLNLSDGGHHENLAAYELLRRRCKFIVCVDGGMEPDMQCVDLIRLERYAAIDLGIRMHYDLGDLLLQANGFGKAYGVLVKIDYNPPKTEADRQSRTREDCEWGWMLYMKLSMIGYGPGYVMDYKRTNPAFPHQTTNDQIYDEAQFEAYRALGEAAAESFFSGELFDGDQPKTAKEWFSGLAASLLPDNDEALSTRAKVEETREKAVATLEASAPAEEKAGGQ